MTLNETHHIFHRFIGEGSNNKSPEVYGNHSRGNAPVINHKRSRPFWLKDLISLKSLRKGDRECEVQLFDRRTGSSETGALPQRFGQEPSEALLSPCQFNRPRLKYKKAVSTLNLETDKKKTAQAPDPFSFNQKSTLIRAGVRILGARYTFSSTRGFWQTFAFLVSWVCSEPLGSLYVIIITVYPPEDTQQ